MADKKRLDVLMLERGLVESRSKAQALIMAREVRVNGNYADKAGMKVATDVDIQLKSRPQYVSRGGDKLAGALNDFAYSPSGLICADVGASTGGFTDCLLQNDAKKIYAIDVGYGQIAHKLRVDERIVVMERTNARYVEDLGEPVDLVVIDASFISLKLLLPVVMKWFDRSGDIIALVKPQFEAGKGEVGKGGVVRDVKIHERVLDSIVIDTSATLGLTICGVTKSPIKGPSGNIEFLVWFHYGAMGNLRALSDDDLTDEIKRVLALE